MQVFRQLTQLQRIDLSDTDVSDGGVVHVSRCSHLAWLSLCNTEAGDACAMNLINLVREAATIST